MKYWKILVLVLFLLALDFLSKYLFCDLWIWKDSFLLEPVINHGISWGMSANLYFVILVSFLWLWAFILLWKKKIIGDWIFIFLIAWTLWNLWDRIFLWGVRDFISIWTFPVFNFADCYLTIAVGLIIIEELLKLKNKKKE